MPAPSSAKRTMLGMPAAGGPPKPASANFAPPPSFSKPAAPAAHAPVPPAIPAPTGGEIEMDWDDDEPPTNIYDKHTAAQMAKAAVAAQPGRPPAPMTAPPKPTITTDASAMLRDSVPPRVRKKRNRAMLVGISVGVIVAVLAAIVVYKLGVEKKAGSVELMVTPGDELSVMLDGNEKVPGNISPILVDNLSEGEHSLIIKREGYKDKKIIFNIRKGVKINTKVSLERGEALSAGFYLETQPPGATVEIDGRVVDDQTPLTVSDLKPGNHVVKVTKEKYRDLKFEVEVSDGKNEKLPLKKLVLKKVELTFNTKPQGANVTLLTNGRRIDLGQTPAVYKIETDKQYKIEYKCGKSKIVKELTEEAYNTGSDKVSLASVKCGTEKEEPKIASSRPHSGGGSFKSSKTAVVIKKPKASGGQGWLSVQTKPWSKVFVNGRFIKNTPLVKHSLKAGKYTVTVENPSFGIKRQFRVTIKAGQTTTLVQKLI
jgi:hypothetical protein